MRRVAHRCACGLPDVQMTSVCRETGYAGTMPALMDAIAASLVPSRV